MKLKKIFLYFLLLIELQVVSNNMILKIEYDYLYCVDIDRHHGRLIIFFYF
jgi:hypothetical protein